MTQLTKKSDGDSNKNSHISPSLKTSPMRYKYSSSQAKTFHKYGVDITKYDIHNQAYNVVYESVNEGHLEEFYSDISTYTWFIIEGRGTYVIDDEHIPVESHDVIVVPPTHRIHYFGTMKMLLITTPPFDEKSEHHVRMISKSEIPSHTHA